MNTQSLYIHIPFCRKKCRYCDFYSIPHNEGAASSYMNVLTQQVESLAGEYSTIYIGGGTPTVLGHALLANLLKRLRRFRRNGLEYTVEANPESLDAGKIKLFLDEGINRLSMGVQSFRDDKLQRLGRIHTAHTARENIARAHKEGFKNISIDLIFGVWDEKPDVWMEELDEALLLPITHLSCYGLTYEKTTPIAAAVGRREIVPLDDIIVAEMYSSTVKHLSKNGFNHYEVSNFAREGCCCRHNLNYWRNGPYRGLGTSAVSYIDGVREKNISDVGEYIRKTINGESTVESREKLSPKKRAQETAALKIRTREGIEYAAFEEDTGFDFLELESEALPELITHGLLEYVQDEKGITGVRPTQKGFLLCDTLSSAFL